MADEDGRMPKSLSENRRMDWVGRILTITQFQPCPELVAPTRSGCPTLHSAWPWASPRMGHLHQHHQFGYLKNKQTKPRKSKTNTILDRITEVPVAQGCSLVHLALTIQTLAFLLTGTSLQSDSTPGESRDFCTLPQGSAWLKGSKAGSHCSCDAIWGTTQGDFALGLVQFDAYNPVENCGLGCLIWWCAVSSVKYCSESNCLCPVTLL